MPKPEDIITEISLNIVVDGTAETLDFPVPFDYDGQEVLDLLMADIMPITDEDAEAALASCGEAAGGIIEPEDVAGEMDPNAYEDWRQRAHDLQEIDWSAGVLDDLGLTPGEWPGIYDDRTGDPSAIMLDETIDNDLHNTAIVANETKAAFRAMRETCGASQAALAEALGVNARTAKRWETPGQPEPPRDAWRLLEGWHADALHGARWHVQKAEQLRDDCHEAYTLVVYRSQEEFDRALAPLLAQAPSYRWQDALAEARGRAIAERGDDSWLEIDHEYTNFPGTRSFWRANAAARLAAVLMDAQGIPYGFAYPSEQQDSLFWEGTWVPCADVQRIEGASGTIVTCGMR